MAFALADRLLTIVVTATVTSAAWIVAAGDLKLVQASANAENPAVRVADPGPAPGPSGPAPASGPLIVPVAGVRPDQLTDTFGDGRSAGIRRHEALDVMAPAGTAVIAAAAGTIEKLFVSNDGGNTIYLRSPDRTTIHYYAHLAGYASGLREGQAVRQGETLGTVGSTGNAYLAAPHLHFAILRTTPEARWWDPATPVNPYPLLRNN